MQKNKTTIDYSGLALAIGEQPNFFRNGMALNEARQFRERVGPSDQPLLEVLVVGKTTGYPGEPMLKEVENRRGLEGGTLWTAADAEKKRVWDYDWGRVSVAIQARH